MNQKDKEIFVQTLCDGLKQYLLDRMEKVPENWDGFELRQWIADTVKELYCYKPLSKGRKQRYNNDRGTRGL